MNCSIAQTLEIIGERWTLLILRDAFRGSVRFQDFLSIGMSRNVLTQRLKTLVNESIFEKHPIDGRASQYLLTSKGRDLLPILLSITHWGDQHMAHPKGLRSICVEKKTDQPIAPMSPYSTDGRALSLSEIVLKSGPGSA
ncbi:MAG: helix-turn-helix domain-containing protein [Pseudomonadota bacterium]